MSVASVASWWACGVLHELSHIAAAQVVGKGCEALTIANFKSALFERRVVIPNTSKLQERVIRHQGWITSVALALYLHAHDSGAVTLGALVVALEAICSDLLGVDFVVSNPRLADAFNCGNFGLILINKEHRNYVVEILHKMVQVTMM